MPSAAAYESIEPPRSVVLLVQRIRRRHLILSLADVGLTGFGIGLLAFGSALLADRFFPLDGPLRVALSAAVPAAVLMACVFRALRVSRRRPLSTLGILRALEALRPDLEEALSSAVEIAGAPASERARFSVRLLERLWDKARNAAARIDPRLLAPTRDLLAPLALAAAGTLVTGLHAALDPPGFQLLATRLLHPTAEVPRPSRVLVDVRPGDAKVARGADLEIEVEILRGNPSEVFVQIQRPGAPAVRRALAPLPSHPRIRRGTIPDVETPLAYRIEAGDYLSRLFRVEPRRPPRPVRFTITYLPPAYSRLPPRREEGPSGVLRALVGSTAEVDVEVDLPAVSAELAVEAGASSVKRRLLPEGRIFHLGRIPIVEAGVYRLVLEGEEGVRWGGKTAFPIVPVPDTPPQVRILSPREDEIRLEAAGILALRVEVEDDVSLEEIRLRSEAVTIALWSRVGTAVRRRIETTFPLAVSRFGLEPGERTTFRVEARDAKGQLASSQERALWVLFPPQSPEGPRWIANLRSLAGALRRLEGELEAASEAVEAPSKAAEAGAGRSRPFLRARALAALIAERAVELARELPVASPDRPALEALAFRLRALAAAARFEAPGGGRLPIACALAAQVARIATSIAEIEEEETLEEAQDRLESLRDELETLGTDPAARRLERLERAALETAALVGGTGGDGDPLRKRWSRELLGGVAGSLRRLRESGAGRGSSAGELERARTVLQAVLGEIHALLEGVRRGASNARLSLEPEQGLGETIAQAAKEPPSSAARLRHAAQALERVALDRERAENRSYTSPLSLAALDALAELLREATAEGAGARKSGDEDRAGGPPPSSVAGGAGDLLQGLAADARELEPLLRLGYAASEAQAAARSAVRAAGELETARNPGPSAARRASAAIAEAAALLAHTTLAAFRGLPRSGPGSEGQGARDRFLRSIREAQRQLADAAKAIRLAARGPAEAIEAAAGDVRAAARTLEDGVESAERALETEHPRATAALRRILARAGTSRELLARLENHLRSLLKRIEEAARAAAPEGAGALQEDARSARRAARHAASALRREAETLLVEGAPEAPVRARELAAGRLDELERNELREVSGAVESALESSKPAEFLARAAKRAAEALETVEALRRALELLEAEALAELEEGSETADLLLRAEEAAFRSDLDPALARRLAEALAKRAADLRERLAEPARVDSRLGPILERLDLAAVEAERARAYAEEGEMARCRDALERAVTAFREAAALAARLREESESALRGGDYGDESAPRKESERNADPTRARILEELERLLELRMLARGIEKLLEELALEGEPPPSRIEAAAEAERRLRDALARKLPGQADLLDLVSRIVLLERDAEALLGAIDGALAVARGLREAPSGERDSEALLDRARALEGELESAGSKLSILLPRVYAAYRSAREAASDARSILERAAEELRGVPQALRADAFEESKRSVTRLVARLEDLRDAALEALASAEGEGGPATLARTSLERALQAAGEAAGALERGDVRGALLHHRNLAGLLRGVAGGLRAAVRGEAGEVRETLPPEAAGSRAWNPATRPDLPAGETALRPPLKWREVPVPPGYEELIEAYRRALETWTRSQ